MPWLRFWVEEETDIGGYILTLCCQQMKFLSRDVIIGNSIDDHGRVRYNVVELIDRDQNKRIATIRYCPNCGTRVQLRRLSDGQ